MKPYVFTPMEDVATTNGRNTDPTEFIEEMKLRGKVVDFDDAVREIRAEYQAIIDNLTAKIKTIADQELTDDEIDILNAYRRCKSATGDKYQERINALEKQLEETSEEQQKRLARIAEILAQ